MEQGKCGTCGIDINPGAYGYCHKCSNDYYRQRDLDYPFIVVFGNDHEEFATEKEADEFCDVLHNAHVEKK